MPQLADTHRANVEPTHVRPLAFGGSVTLAPLKFVCGPNVRTTTLKQCRHIHQLTMRISTFSQPSILARKLPSTPIYIYTHSYRLCVAMLVYKNTLQSMIIMLFYCTMIKSGMYVTLKSVDCGVYRPT